MNVTELFDVSDIPMPDKWPTTFTAVVPRITGILSVMSSSIIIYVVYRSAARTSTIYHRIMVGMSMCDILASTAVSLTSLPMPKQLPFEDELRSSSSSPLDNWDPGPRYGNTYTCNAQGFFAISGAFAIFLFNVALCVYYGCSIGLQMREDKIRKYIQPILLGAPILFGLFTAIPALFFEMMNPPTTPWQAPWCVAFAYPYGCSDDEEADNTCIRGSMAFTETSLAYSQLLLRVSMFFLVLSLALVIWRVVYTNRKLRIARNYKEAGEGDITEAGRQKRRVASIYLYSDEDNLTLEQHYMSSCDSKKKVDRAAVNTRAVLIQCLAYIVAWFLGVAWDFIPLGMTRFKVGLIFFPLQGFFNMIIFICHKVYNYRKLHPEESICDVLETMFTGHIQEPCFISRISFVMDDGNVSALDKFPSSPEKRSNRLQRKGLQLTPKSNFIYPEEDNGKELQAGTHVDAPKITKDNHSVQDDGLKDISMLSSQPEINISPPKKSRDDRRRVIRRNIEDSSNAAFDDDDEVDTDGKEDIEESSWDEDIADFADLSGFSSVSRSTVGESRAKKGNVRSSASSFFSKFSGLSWERS